MQPELIGDRYRVESAAGRGGMGTVWLCHDERLDREVAVKQVGLLPNQSVTDSARAFREARSSAGLNHRNVVTVFDVVEQDDHIWLVMEYVPGRSLSQIIREDGPLPPRDVAHIGAQVAEGLALAHAAGISHRDVKPGNVLVRADGVAKISDFGIARTHGDPALTQSGFLTGTPTYFSPQLARGGEPTQADDVWALGATLYAAVEGHPLFEQHPNPVAVLHDIASGRARPPERAGFLDEALRSMLTSDPDTRWSMAYAGRRLRELAARREGDSQLLPTRELAETPLAPQTPAHPVPDREPEAVAPPAPEPTRTPEPTPEPTPGPTPPAASAPPASPRPSSAAPVPSGRDRPARRRWPVLVAAVAVLALAGLVWALTRPDPGSGGQAGTGGAAGSDLHPPPVREVVAEPVEGLLAEGHGHPREPGRGHGDVRAGLLRGRSRRQRRGVGDARPGRAGAGPRRLRRLLAHDQLGRGDLRDRTTRDRLGRGDPGLPDHRRDHEHRAQA